MQIIQQAADIVVDSMISLRIEGKRKILFSSLFSFFL